MGLIIIFGNFIWLVQYIWWWAFRWSPELGMNWCPFDSPHPIPSQDPARRKDCFPGARHHSWFNSLSRFSPRQRSEISSKAARLQLGSCGSRRRAEIGTNIYQHHFWMVGQLKSAQGNFQTALGRFRKQFFGIWLILIDPPPRNLTIIGFVSSWHSQCWNVTSSLCSVGDKPPSVIREGAGRRVSRGPSAASANRVRRALEGARFAGFFASFVRAFCTAYTPYSDLYDLMLTIYIIYIYSILISNCQYIISPTSVSISYQLLRLQARMLLADCAGGQERRLEPRAACWENGHTNSFGFQTPQWIYKDKVVKGIFNVNCKVFKWCPLLTMHSISAPQSKMSDISKLLRRRALFWCEWPKHESHHPWRRERWHHLEDLGCGNLANIILYYVNADV